MSRQMEQPSQVEPCSPKRAADEIMCYKNNQTETHVSWDVLIQKLRWKKPFCTETCPAIFHTLRQENRADLRQGMPHRSRMEFAAVCHNRNPSHGQHLLHLWLPWNSENWKILSNRMCVILGAKWRLWKASKSKAESSCSMGCKKQHCGIRHACGHISVK